MTTICRSLIAVSSVILSAGCSEAPSTVSRETTFLTSPVREDGTIDYRAAINTRYGRGVTPDNNAAIYFARRDEGIPSSNIAAAWGFDAQVIVAPFVSAATCERKANCPSVESMRTSGNLSRDAMKASQGPWSRRDFQSVAAWLDDLEPALAAFADVLERPHFFVPEGNPGESYVDLHSVAELGSAVFARAFLRLDEGDTRRAFDDVALVYRLASRMQQFPDETTRMVATVLRRDAARNLTVLLAGRISVVDDLENLQSLFAELPPIHRAPRYWSSLACKAFTIGRSSPAAVPARPSAFPKPTAMSRPVRINGIQSCVR